MKNTILAITLTLFLAACTTTRYMDPIELSQEEIHSMKIKNQYGFSYKAHAGRIKGDRCFKGTDNLTEDCSVIICRDDTTQPTGLRCEEHLPLTAVDFVQNKKIDSIEKEKIVTALNEYTNKKDSKLISYCHNENVICYMNKKFFPSDKVSTIDITKKYKFKEVFNEGQKNELEVTIY